MTVAETPTSAAGVDVLPHLLQVGGSASWQRAVAIGGGAPDALRTCLQHMPAKLRAYAFDAQSAALCRERVATALATERLTVVQCAAADVFDDIAASGWRRDLDAVLAIDVNAHRDVQALTGTLLLATMSLRAGGVLVVVAGDPTSEKGFEAVVAELIGLGNPRAWVGGDTLRSMLVRLGFAVDLILQGGREMHVVARLKDVAVGDAVLQVLSRVRGTQTPPPPPIATATGSGGIDACVPRGERVLLAADGDASTIVLDGREVSAFAPTVTDAALRGMAAVAELEARRRDGYRAIVFTRGGLKQLASLADLRLHLDTCYMLRHRADDGVVYELRDRIPGPPAQWLEWQVAAAEVLVKYRQLAASEVDEWIPAAVRRPSRAIPAGVRVLVANGAPAPADVTVIPIDLSNPPGDEAAIRDLESGDAEFLLLPLSVEGDRDRAITRRLAAQYQRIPAGGASAYRLRDVGPDGLMLPPSRLIYMTTAQYSQEAFYWNGVLGAFSIRRALAKNGIALEQQRRVLDFGCGCGRVLRNWRGVQGPQFYGTDYNVELVDWCRRELPFAQYATNEPSPPLSYADNTFDLIYAISILTHLTEAQQRAWMAELRRVIAPGGHLLVTVHGNSHIGKLPDPEKARFTAGEMVVLAPEYAGLNFCATFHPERYVRDELARDFRLVDYVPVGARDAGQDIVLLQKAGLEEKTHGFKRD